MSQWVDVGDDGDAVDTPASSSPPPPPPPQRARPGNPFGVPTVDKIAYVDSDDPVELRFEGDPTVGLDKPPTRQKPQPRRQQGREKKWLPADEPKAPRESRGVVGKLIRTLVAVVIFGGLAYGAWTLITWYQSSVFDPVPPPASTVPAAPQSPAAPESPAAPSSAAPSAPTPSGN